MSGARLVNHSRLNAGPARQSRRSEKIGAMHAYPDPGLRSIGIESGRDPPSTTIAG
jgi:hypothetical protein